MAELRLKDGMVHNTHSYTGAVKWILMIERWLLDLLLSLGQ